MARRLVARGFRNIIDGHAEIFLSFASIGLSAVSFIALPLLSPGNLNPLSQQLSDYVHIDGSGWLFVFGTSAIAVGNACTTLGFARAGLLESRLLGVTMSVVIICAVLTAVFPTDNGLPLSLTGEIHRYASVILFIALPVIAVVAAVVVGRDAWLLGMSLLAIGVLTVLLLSHLAVVPDVVRQHWGLFQRVLVVIGLGVLVRLALIAYRERRRMHD